MAGGVVAAFALLALDLARPPAVQLSSRALQRLVRLYQAAVPKVKPLRGHCRLRPTCSEYALTVLREHGTLRGSWLTMRRILRCGPWTAAGTKDPPPPAHPPTPKVENPASKAPPPH
ncbi:MAG TPA: membrane protein insertion efficiency factor YidD [Thermoanaerobaculaceae bacterium]|nr:membrane protein insertion efficiency factor YidD [Thermoanaerobaculaceae bacterium]HRS16698.1 membrane protein insertion efficiency factor YidD [Thermoanaerobaculaceae bacterium]